MNLLRTAKLYPLVFFFFFFFFFFFENMPGHGRDQKKITDVLNYDRIKRLVLKFKTS